MKAHRACGGGAARLTRRQYFGFDNGVIAAFWGATVSRIVCSLTDIEFKPDLCRLLGNACYRVVLFTFVWYPPLSPKFCFDSPQCSFPRSLSFNVFNDLTRYMKKAMLILIRNSLSFVTQYCRHQTWSYVFECVHLTFLLFVL